MITSRQKFLYVKFVTIFKTFTLTTEKSFPCQQKEYHGVGGEFCKVNIHGRVKFITGKSLHFKISLENLSAFC